MTQPSSIEQWKPVAGFESLYEVSSLGRVRSISNYVHVAHASTPYSRLVKARILKLYLNPTCHYLYVMLTKDGKHRNLSVHRLVAKAFLENPENKPQVNHLKRPKTNNAVTNLEWATYAEDLDHAVANGLKPRGSKHWHAKLTEAQVMDMRMLRVQGWTQPRLMTRYGVSQATVSAIVRGSAWKHVSMNAQKKPSTSATSPLKVRHG